MEGLEYTGTDNLEVMTEAANYNRFLLNLISRNSGGAASIVDFGAGIGTFAAALSESGRNVHCVEPDMKQAAVIADRGLAVSSDIDALVDGTVDVVYSLNVLEHIDDDAGALRLIARKVKVGGRVLIYVPAFPLLYSSMDRKVGHCRRYRLQEICRKAEAAGLKVIEARYVDCLGFFASLLFKAVGNDSGEIHRAALIAYDRYAFPLSRVADRVFDRFFGKNLFVSAIRSAEQLS
jgi:2-polyprenyl-3-methyl-5-hydroxy-6-metoxy-1,4-benzoquinol methylase